MKTQKALIIIGLVFSLGLNLKAQDFKFGLLSGLVVSNAFLTDKIDIYSDYRVFYPMYSFNINGYFEYKISKTWGIEAEPGFIRKGGIVRFGVNHYMSVIDMKLNYLQLPVLANFYCTNRFFVSIGPEIAYMISREENLPDPASGFKYFKENALEISGMIGLNYSLSKKIDLGLRYNLGFTNISILEWSEGYGPETGASNVYNQYFQLIFRFNIRRADNEKVSTAYR